MSKDGNKTFLLVAFLALAVGGITAVYAFSSSSNVNVDDVQQQGTVQAGQEQAPAGAATTANDEAGTDENGGEVGATATIVVPTDDPSYLSCLQQPLAANETGEQRTTYCNEQLAKQQAVQQPSDNQPNHRLPNGDEAFGPPANPSTP